MFEVAKSPDQHQAGQRKDSSTAPARPLASRPDLLIDEPEQRGHDQPENQRQQYDRLDDKYDVPRVPAPVKRLEQANAVSGGVVQQEVAERRQQRQEIEVTPAHRRLRLPAWSMPQPEMMQDVNEAQG